MGINCDPLLADIFLYSYEAEFIQSLLSTGRKQLASRFNFTYRYIDDVLSINSPEFKNYLGQMYPVELEIKDTTESNTSASYLDLLLSIGRDGQLHTSIYDKRDDFNFHITNFPFLSSNIPTSPAYGVFISQLIRYNRACSWYGCFILRATRLSNKLLWQGYAKERLKSSLRKFYGRYGDLIKQYEVSLSQMLNDILWPDRIQWQPPTDQTLYRSRPFTECWDQSFSELVVILPDYALRISLGTFSILLITSQSNFKMIQMMYDCDTKQNTLLHSPWVINIRITQVKRGEVIPWRKCIRSRGIVVRLWLRNIRVMTLSSAQDKNPLFYKFRFEFLAAQVNLCQWNKPWHTPSQYHVLDNGSIENMAAVSRCIHLLLIPKETSPKTYILFQIGLNLWYRPYAHFGYWSLVSDP